VRSVGREGGLEKSISHPGPDRYGPTTPRGASISLKFALARDHMGSTTAVHAAPRRSTRSAAPRGHLLDRESVAESRTVEVPRPTPRRADFPVSRQANRSIERSKGRTTIGPPSPIAIGKGPAVHCRPITPPPRSTSTGLRNHPRQHPNRAGCPGRPKGLPSSIGRPGPAVAILPGDLAHRRQAAASRALGALEPSRRRYNTSHRRPSARAPGSGLGGEVQVGEQGVLGAQPRAALRPRPGGFLWTL